MIRILLHDRLGNQMFQYAFARKINIDSGNQDIYIDETLLRNGDKSKWWENGLKYFNTSFNILKENDRWYRGMSVYQKYLFLLKKLFGKTDYNSLHKNGLLFESSKQKICRGGYSLQKNCYLNGYFEDVNLFYDIADELRKEFTPIYDQMKENAELYNQINKYESICVSVRCGGFISDPVIRDKFYVCTPAYYRQAVAHIINKGKLEEDKVRIIIFSDDIEWCKSNLDFSEYGSVLYERGNDPIWEKLRLMYSCKYFVISNSTFSWWSQFLNANSQKMVVAPFPWRFDGSVCKLYTPDMDIIDVRNMCFIKYDDLLDYGEKHENSIC